VHQIGSSLGTAVSGSGLSAALALTLPRRLDDAAITGPSADSIAEATQQSAGSSIAQLREQGGNGPFGEQTGAVVQALSEGVTNAAQWSLVAATAFLALGFVGALRVCRAAAHNSNEAKA
jgi:drug resistance efflux protein